MIRISDVIRHINPDVLALQKVESRGYLKRFLDVYLDELGYRHIIHFDGNDGRGIDVFLVSCVPAGPVTSYRHLTFRDSTGAEQQFQRDLLSVRIELVDGDPLDVWVVHLKSKSGEAVESESIRVAEATMIRELLDEQLQKDLTVRIVVCGDLNDTMRSPSVQMILKSGPLGLRSFIDELP